MLGTCHPYISIPATDPVLERRVIVGNDFRRDYPRNPREFEGWLRANTVLGSILAMGILAMAVAGLYSAGRPDVATEFSSVTASK